MVIFFRFLAFIREEGPILAHRLSLRGTTVKEFNAH